jgi:dihydroxyacetone kinase-like protein
MAAWLTAFAGAVAREKDHLTTLDSAIGDADHGANLDRGAQAVLASVGADPLSTPGAVAKAAGMSLIRTVGGASGPLYGTFFLRFATAAGEEQALDAGGLAAALRAGVEGLAARGRSSLQDKTMLDAFFPAVDALDAALAADAELAAALVAAADAAESGRDATIPLVARKGRASYLGERSAGHADPGATSAALLMRAAVGTLA